MKYRSVLVDDEPLALQRLERLLKPHGEMVEVIGQAQSGPEAVELINRLNPDLVFLDIQIPELDGFGVLSRLQVEPWIIFCTAYDQYAIRAFDTNSLDYLLKPVEPDRLKKALDKLQRLAHKPGPEWHNQLQALLAGLKPASKRWIQVRSRDKILLLNVENVHFFRAADDYVEVHTFDACYLLSQPLSQVEADLTGRDFVRIHRSAIINLNFLGEIEQWFAGRYRARMRDKKSSTLEVSRSCKSKLGL